MSILAFDRVAKSLPHGFWMQRRPVLHDVTLEVERGEVYGFIGPNGAGKTTSIKCLVGLLTPDAGRIEVLGEPGATLPARQRLGFLPEQPYFYPHLTGRELLGYLGRLFDLDAATVQGRAGELLETVGLTDAADKPIRQYSKGMLQRIGVAQALINEPELVVLDEPTTGLDPIGRREMKDLIVGLRERGVTVFFSSHILQDAEALCDRVALIVGGRIVRQGPLAELLEERVVYWETACELPDLPETAAGGGAPPAAEGSARRGPELAGVAPFSVQGARAFYRLDDPDRLDHWVDAVRAAGGRVVQVAPHRVTLEDYFMTTVRDGGDTTGPGGPATARGSGASEAPPEPPEPAAPKETGRPEEEG